jgi:uncharacterized membrane protein YhdT
MHAVSYHCPLGVILSGNLRIMLVCEKLRTSFIKYCTLFMLKTSYVYIWKPVNLCLSNLPSWFQVSCFMQPVTHVKWHWSCSGLPCLMMYRLCPSPLVLGIKHVKCRCQPLAATKVAPMDSDAEEEGRRPGPHHRAPTSSSRESLATMMPLKRSFLFHLLMCSSLVFLG